MNETNSAGGTAPVPEPHLLPIDAAARLYALVASLPDGSAAGGTELAGGMTRVAVADLARSFDEVDRAVDPVPVHLHEVVADFGRDQAAGGFDPADVVAAVTSALAALDAPRRADLDLTELQRIALTAWAQETGRLAQLDQCLDAFTGLHSDAYLRTHLAQLFERCDALRVRPSAMYGVLCIQLTDANVDPLVSLTAVRSIVDHLRRELSAGETVAACNRSTFVALVPVHAIAEVSVSVQAAFAVDPALDQLSWYVSAVPLGASMLDALATLDALNG